MKTSKPDPRYRIERQYTRSNNLVGKSHKHIARKHYVDKGNIIGVRFSSIRASTLIHQPHNTSSSTSNLQHGRHGKLHLLHNAAARAADPDLDRSTYSAIRLGCSPEQDGRRSCGYFRGYPGIHHLAVCRLFATPRRTFL